MELTEALVWIISGGGAAYVGFWLVEHVAWFGQLASDLKRYAAFGLTAILAIAAWVAMIAVTGEPWPVGWQSWLSALFSVAATAIIAGQAVHGAVVLRKA